MTERRRFYLDRYTDEVVPCDCTLEGWAEWLAKGGDEGGGAWSFEPPEHGATYKASVLRFLDDVEVTRDDDKGLTFRPELPSKIDFAAVRFGPGMGWDCDSILDPGDIAGGLIEEVCPLLEPGETANLAIAVDEPDVLLRFERSEGGAPRLVVAEVVQ
jgi:hypothetical protein